MAPHPAPSWVGGRVNSTEPSCDGSQEDLRVRPHTPQMGKTEARRRGGASMSRQALQHLQAVPPTLRDWARLGHQRSRDLGISRQEGGAL